MPLEHAGRDVALVNQLSFADGLVAVRQQYDTNVDEMMSSLLLTGGTALDRRVAAELARIAPAEHRLLHVTLYGTRDVLSSTIQSSLASAGYTLNRVGGADRYATAAAAAGLPVVYVGQYGHPPGFTSVARGQVVAMAQFDLSGLT